MRRCCLRCRQPDEAQAQAALRAFELMLLREIGVLPELSGVTLTLQPVRPDAPYALRPEVGVAPRGRAEPASPAQQLVALQAALEHGSVDRASRRLCAALPALRGALRTLLHYHLGTPVLRTRQVMADVRKLLDPPQARR